MCSEEIGEFCPEKRKQILMKDLPCFMSIYGS